MVELASSVASSVGSDGAVGSRRSTTVAEESRKAINIMMCVCKKQFFELISQQNSVSDAATQRDERSAIDYATVAIAIAAASSADADNGLDDDDDDDADVQLRLARRDADERARRRHAFVGALGTSLR